MTHRAPLLLAAVCFAGAAGFLIAGPLTPPAGSVAPTHKTLTEVEPRTAINAANTPGDANSTFRIAQPGSYYLTGNVTGAAGRHGIEIAASGVTIDLNGFELIGVPGMGAFDGVNASGAGLSDLVVRNGSIRGWGDAGVDLSTAAAVNCRLERLSISNSAGHGISVVGPAVITGCTLRGNQLNGINAGNTCVITDCVATQGGGNGIAAGTGATISNCTASGNATHGFSIVGSSSLSNCSAALNSASGFSVSGNVAMFNCTAISNTANGITVSGVGTVLNCFALSNGASGIVVGAGSTVGQSAARQNIQHGILAAPGSTITDCAAWNNILDGIQASSNCLIRGNTCDGNGNSGDGAGVHVTGVRNRIEGNVCSNADRGIDVDGAGNVIVGNTCSTNTTDWTFVANNIYGPIIDRRAPGSAPVSGFSFASTLGSTDANANYSH